MTLRLGRGCGAGSPIVGQKQDLIRIGTSFNPEKWAKEWPEKWAKEWETWLKTPEGLAQELVRAELAKRAEEKKQQEEAAKELWFRNQHAIRQQKPKVGSIITSLDGPMLICLKSDKGRYFAWALLRCPDTMYPEMPIWQFGCSRYYGLKMFFNRDSVECLFAIDPEAKETVDRIQAQNASALEKWHEQEFDRYEDFPGIQNAEATIKSEIDRVRIIGYSQSGKSGQVALI